MSQTSTGLAKIKSSARAAKPMIRARPAVRLLSYRDLREIKGLKFSRQWIDKLIKAGRFPRPIHPGGGDRGYLGWLEHEVDAHIAACAAARDAT
jgi:predicted DNA-binding transcriptional regulator AlpA